MRLRLAFATLLVASMAMGLTAGMAGATPKIPQAGPLASGTQAAPSPGADESSRVVVVMASGPATMGRMRSSAVAAGGRVLESSSRVRAMRVAVPAGTTARAFAARLRGMPGVVSAEPQHLMRAADVAVNDPLFSAQWGMMRVNAPQAWDTTMGSPSVIVAVVDTGVDEQASDLVGRLDLADGYDFVDNDADPQDENGHGTHVAGIVAATANNGIGIAGVAPQCRVMPVRVLAANGNGDDYDVALGIRWAVDRGAQIVNLSLGDVNPSTVVGSAVAYAYDHGVLVVAAAGNAGTYDGRFISGRSLYYPAAYRGAFGVSATTPDDVLASWSLYGPQVDIAAPGEDIVSTGLGVSSYSPMDGTSFATPFVSGAAALVLSQYPGLSPDAVASALDDGALDLGDPGLDEQYGYGRLDIGAAFAKVAATRDAYESDDTSAQARPVVLGQWTAHTSAPRGDRDWVSFQAQAGHWYMARTGDLTGGADTMLYLYAPDGSFIAHDDDVTPTDYSSLIWLHAASTGTYLLENSDVYGRGGAYRMQVAEATGTAFGATTGPTSVVYDGKVTLTASLSSALGGRFDGVVRVEARSWDATAWAAVGTVPLRVGKAPVTVIPRKTTAYRFDFDGDAALALAPSVSVAYTVKPTIHSYTPTTPSSARRSQLMSVVGIITPRRTLGSLAVTLRFYRKIGTKWVSRRTVRVRVANHGDSSSYLQRVALTERGSWRVRADAAGDAGIGTGISPYRYFSVR